MELVGIYALCGCVEWACGGARAEVVRWRGGRVGLDLNVAVVVVECDTCYE